MTVPAPDYLSQALEAEAAKQWLKSHALCDLALESAPEDPDALNLLGRLCGLAGDAAKAIALQSFVLHLVPGHERAGDDLQKALRAIASRPDAQRIFGQAVEIEPDIECHHRHVLSLWPFVGMDRCEALLRHCLSLDPSHARAHAALGNVLSRRRHSLDAITAYGLATMLRWDFSTAHLALADLLDSLREESTAQRHRAEAISQQRLFPACAYSKNAVHRVLVLAAPGGVIANAPLDLVVNAARTALHRYYLVKDEPLPEDLPAHDLIFNGMEELESSAAAIALAANIASNSHLPVVNDPKALIKTRRCELARSLAGIASCKVPPAERLSRGELDGPAALRSAGVDFPLLIRPIDSHRGDGLERIVSFGELQDYLHRHTDSHYNVSAFADYRSEDGYYRKYRVIVVDGQPFPYHLAISSSWMVHYIGSPMREHSWMRLEEERFLAEPSAVFRRWGEPFVAIAEALGLDYFGVDCSIAGDGSVLVFECGAGMLVHCYDDADVFPYKYRYVPRIFDAMERMLERRS